MFTTYNMYEWYIYIVINNILYACKYAARRLYVYIHEHDALT